MSEKQTAPTLPNFVENIVLIAIIGVLAHTAIFELHAINGWSYNSYRILVIIGFSFDAFFTIEFIVRTILAKKGRGFRHYFIYERGWVDFFASVPLLLLDSGPALLFLLFPDSMTQVGGLGLLNSLKSIKAIRVTRILRLLRILKIFGKIQNTESTMASRHIASISTITIVTIILVMAVFSGFQLTTIEELSAKKDREYQSILDRTMKMAQASKAPMDRALIRKYFSMQVANYQENTDIMLVLDGKNNEVIVQNYRQNILTEKFNVRYSDGQYHFHDRTQVGFLFSENDKFKLVIDKRSLLEYESRNNIMFFSVIVVLVLSFMFIYSKSFAQTISDPIEVMRLGMEKPDYNLEVLTNKHYPDDEIFRLVEEYNEKWLPLKHKERSKSGAGAGVELSLEDFMGAAGKTDLDV